MARYPKGWLRMSKGGYLSRRMSRYEDRYQVQMFYHLEVGTGKTMAQLSHYTAWIDIVEMSVFSVVFTKGKRATAYHKCRYVQNCLQLDACRFQ